MDNIFSKSETLQIPKIRSCSDFGNWIIETILLREGRNDSISETFIVDRNSMFYSCIKTIDFKRLNSFNCRDKSEGTLDEIRVNLIGNEILYYNSWPRTGGKEKKTHIHD